MSVASPARGTLDAAPLLAIDVGNTNISFGLFDQGRKLIADWRLETRTGRTTDEYAALLDSLFRRAGLELEAVKAVAISSVVPPIITPLEQLCRQELELEPLVVGPGTKTGVPVLYENPREVGADRIVNAVAALARWPQGAIVVDFGTATTFDVVTARGEYAGGVIAPGLTVAADALFPPRRSAATPSPACRRGWCSATRASSTPSSSASGPRSTFRPASSAPAGWRRSSPARPGPSTSATTC
jgi:pantothenate kinase type III